MGNCTHCQESEGGDIENCISSYDEGLPSPAVEGGECRTGNGSASSWDGATISRLRVRNRVNSRPRKDGLSEDEEIDSANGSLQQFGWDPSNPELSQYMLVTVAISIEKQLEMQDHMIRRLLAESDAEEVRLASSHAGGKFPEGTA
mmetsp:Transcript_32475/g.71009  ORF Transcript_32475/g.71009 Transcript_32475/m.71009 type:complete len:146 (-) Transcript_32475:392-829(-)